MVRIAFPNYNQVQTNQLPSPLAPVNVPPAAAGLGTAVGLHGFGTDMARIAIQERQAQNQIQVTQASASAEKWVTDNIYGPGGFNEMGGQQAMERGATIMQDYQAHIAKVRSGLHGEAQRMFDQGYAADALVRVDRGVQTRLSAVRTEYDDNTMAATAAQLDNSAATAAAKGGVGVIHRPDGSVELEDSAIHQLRDLKVAARVLWLQRNGHRLAGDKRLAGKQMIESDISKMHTDILDAVVVEPGGEEIAREYFNKYKDEIVPEVRAKYQKSITESYELAQVETAAQGAYDKYEPAPLDDQDVDAGRDPTVAVMTTVELEQAAVEQVRKDLKGSPRLKEAEQRVRDLFQERRYVDEGERAEKYVSLSDDLDRGLTSPDPEVRKTAWRKVENHPWFQRVLREDQRTNLRSKAQRLSAKEEVVTDEKLYYELLTSSQDPELSAAFNRLNLRDYEEQIDGPRLRALQNIQADNIGMSQGKASTGAYLGIRGPKEIADQFIKNNSMDAEEAAEFYARLEEVVVSDQANMDGAKLNSVQIQERADALWSSIVLQPQRWWQFKGAEHIYEIEPADMAIADVPEEFQAEMRSYGMTEFGVEPDETELKRLYIKHLRRVGAKGHEEAIEAQIRAKGQ